MKWVALLIFLSASTVAAQDPGNSVHITPYVQIEGFRWEELGGDQKRILKESGPRYSLGFLTRLPFVQGGRFFGEMDLKGTLGSVTYDGALVDPQGGSIPYSTKTAYVGFEGTLDLGYSFRLPRPFLLTPLAGLGIEYWTRNLDSGGPYEYTERYQVISLDIGLRLTYAPRDALHIFATAFLSLPQVIDESFTVALPGQEPRKVVLHPGINPQFNPELGGKMGGFSASVSYEAWTLSRSGTSLQFYQPTSTRSTLGVKLGYTIGLW